MAARFQKYYEQFVQQPISIAPLITFRILFGALMMIGAIRFMLNGWIEKLYIEPHFFFKFFGFSWVSVLDETGMYFLYASIALSALLIMLGYLYRFAAILFFLSFTYVELIDATNYLNHYYLVCLLGFILIFLPANAASSLDSYFDPNKRKSKVPAWCINIIVLKLTIVYTFAGIAKLNPDWLFRAMPLTVWLPEHTNLPIIGPLFQYKWTHFAFSWMAAFYDLTIAYFLIWRRTRSLAYFAVIGFHVMTAMLFNIGLFPMIMMTSTLIFFSGEWHERLLSRFGWKSYNTLSKDVFVYRRVWGKIMKPVFLAVFILQLVLPFRYLLYPGYLPWTEQGYRFSWRVMLVEKIGQATFYVQDSNSERRQEVINGTYLTQFQEKQMCIQPDFILQFAHFLKNTFETKHGFVDPVITVDAHVALNGRASQQFIDPTTNLAEITDGFYAKKWILPFHK